MVLKKRFIFQANQVHSVPYFLNKGNSYLDLDNNKQSAYSDKIKYEKIMNLVGI